MTLSVVCALHVACLHGTGGYASCRDGKLPVACGVCVVGGFGWL
jgi:hypothetical protein